jgi:Fe-S-cluster containining protein
MPRPRYDAAVDPQFSRTVEEVARRPEVLEAVSRLYADVQREIDSRKPVCVMSGRCCRFEEYGHRLFVTTVELAAFVHDLRQRETNSPPHSWDGSGCPFQSNKMCGVHAIRPFGCRMFFCDATSTEWQNGQYEQFHARLRRLHEELNVPYFYVEWRLALGALGLSGRPSSF